MADELVPNCANVDNRMNTGFSYVAEVFGAKEGPMTDLESLISIDTVSLGVVADDWRAAVRAAGVLLVDAGVKSF